MESPVTASPRRSPLQRSTWRSARPDLSSRHSWQLVPAPNARSPSLHTSQEAPHWLFHAGLGEHMSPRDHFESASKYNGIVLGVGYAGFFGLWTIVKDQGHQYTKLHAIAALLIGFSLTFFVLWEVYCMFANTVTLSHPKTMGPARHRLVRFAHSSHDGFERVWPWVFGPTLIAGLGGISCLAWILVANVVGAFGIG